MNLSAPRMNGQSSEPLMRTGSSWSRREAFINSKARLQSQDIPQGSGRKAFGSSTSCKRQEEGIPKMSSSRFPAAFIGSSCRSIASSITFLDDVDDEASDEMMNSNDREEENFKCVDITPYIPRRQNSFPKPFIKPEDNMISKTDHVVSCARRPSDSPPTKPRRSGSFASMLDDFSTSDCSSNTDQDYQGPSTVKDVLTRKRSSRFLIPSLDNDMPTEN